LKSKSHHYLAPSDQTPEELRAASGFLTPDLPVALCVASPRIWLASASPRRAELLEKLSVPLDFLPNFAEEAAPTEEDNAHPARYVQTLARHKSQNAILDSPTGFDIILTADTIVWHEGAILNKPVDEAEARLMLQRLRASMHWVYTGVCLRVERNGASRYFEAQEKTAVHFRDVDDEWIARYIQSGEPMDKAGAYAAQGRGAMLVERIEGDYMNVVGLPLSRLSKLLEEVGAPVENWWL
jgi:septum formation protein